MYLKKRLSLVDAASSLAASLALMFLVFQDFDPRFLVFFAIALACAEIFIRVRWRVTVACARCGFDPVLYKRDPARAAAKVKALLDSRREDPLAALAPPPKLPVIVRKRGSPHGRPVEPS